MYTKHRISGNQVSVFAVLSYAVLLGWHARTRTFAGKFTRRENANDTEPSRNSRSHHHLACPRAVSSDTLPVAPRQHAPIRITGINPDGSVVSSNWSGYAVTGTFTQAAGSWTVPSVDCKRGDKYAAFWVGIDGYSSTTVEQTGTDSDCDGSSPSYYAWYEFYPSASHVISSLSIQPGDHMYATIVYNGSEFTATITDERTGKSFSTSATVAKAARSSAEWIAEAPSSFEGVLPLANFGTVDFGNDYTGVSGTCEATAGGGSEPIGDFSDIFSITMEKRNGKQEAVPSALSSDGTSFTVTWK
jgi:Peptidase A4 family